MRMTSIFQGDLTFLREQARVLEMVATGAPLDETLEELIRLIEAQEAGVRCGILIVGADGAHFLGGCSGGLPRTYQDSLDGAPIAPPYLGACGEAAHTGKAVTVSDLKTETRYAPAWRGQLIACGVRAMRSTPVRSADGKVLASFAIYYDDLLAPGPAQPQLVETATHLATIAIQRKHEENTHRKRERRLGFLAQLSEALRQAAGPGDVLEVAAAMLGKYLDATVVGYSEADEHAEHVFVERDWVGPEGISVVGRHRLRDYGDAMTDELRAGRTVRIADTADSSLVAEPGRAALYEAVGCRSCINVPLVRNERLTGILFVSCNRPRAWTDDETHLVEEVAERTQASLERARAESALLESEERHRLTIESATGYAIVAIGMDGSIVGWNPGAQRLMGYTQAEAIGRPSSIFFTSEDVAAGAPGIEMQRARTLGRAENERWHLRKDGSRFWGSGLMMPLTDGHRRGYVKIFQDKTAEHVAGAALRESEARLQAILHTAPVGIVLAEAPSGRMLFGNGAMERIFRHPMRYSDDVDGYGEWEAYHADGRRVEGHEYPLGRVLATGRSAQGEYHYACGDGVRRWIGVLGSPVRDRDGRVTGAVVVCVDIDASKQAQAVLARGRAELEQLVTERTRELEAAQAQLALTRRVQALGQLAGGIAHDFNNIVQAVQGGAGLIRRRRADPEAVDHLARMIEDAARRGASITGRLLTFARRGELRAEPIDAASLLDDMREVLAHTMGAAIGLRVEAAAALPMLQADRSQLETVLINLAANGRDAMPHGGTLTLSAREEIVGADTGRAGGLLPGRYIRLSVSDTGHGMTPEILARASEPFFTTKPQGSGTGLGLAMARGFADQSGGALAVRSAPDAGTTITLWFPVASETAAAGDAAASETGAAGRVLVVDDEELVREVLAEGLKEHGYEVLRASDARTALAILDAGADVDVLLTDYAMPGLDGVALIEKARQRRPGLPALLLSGNAGGQVEAKLDVNGLMSGSFSLMRKPVGTEQLAQRIQLLLEEPVGAPGGA